MASMRDAVPYNRPNWTTPEPTPAAPGTALVPSSRPNWTTPPMRQQPAVDFDPGPGNPRVPRPGMSAEAQAFRAPPAGAPVAPATPPADQGNLIQRAMRSMRSGASAAADAAGSAARTGKALGVAALPAGVGAGVGALQRMADESSPTPEPFVPPTAKPGDIPTGGVTAPKAIEQHPLGFGPDNEFTRNLANTANALFGLSRPAVGAVNAASRFMREGSGFAAGAARAESAAQKAIPFVQSAQAGSALAAPEPAAPSMRPDPFAPNANGQPGGTVPGTGVPMPPNPNGTISRVGNSYSGADIKFGADIDDPRNPSKGVTSLDMSEGRRQDALELGRMRDLPRSVTTGDGGSTLGQGPIGFGDPQAAERERSNRESSFKNALSDIRNSNMKPRDKRAAMALAQEQYMGTQRMENERATASMRESGDMARANLSAGVQRENNAATTNATMRGQDMNYQGQVLSVRQAQAAAQRAQANTDREYMRAKGNDEFTQGQQAIKDLHQEIGGMIPPTTDRDGKTTPDTENAARYATAMQAMVGRMGKTMKDVTASDKARFVAGMQLSDVANATATGGLTPWGTRAVQSSEPILALRKLPNGDYQTNRVGVNGETEVIPGRYIEKEGSTLGFGGRASNKFKPLME